MMMKNRNQKIVGNYSIGIYVRVSTEEQAENPEGSIRSQEHRLREFVKHKNSFENFGEIKEFYCDAGISAKDTNRPEFQKMMEDVRNKKINMILITELSRLTRSIRDFANLVEMLDEMDCQIYSLKDQFDSSTAVGSFSMYLMANLAQFERKQIGERIAANFLSRAKRGLYNGGSVPLGYRVSGKQDGRLEVIPSEAETVRDIFKTFLSEGTLASTTKALNAKKVMLKRQKEGGGKSRVGFVMLESLYKMLTNKIYLGIRVYVENGKECEVKAQWEPIINEDVFKRVGEILKANKSRKKSSPLRYPYLLSGILHCDCGHRLSGKSAHGNGGKIAYYDHVWAAKIENVIGSRSLVKCDPQRVLADKLEPVVWSAVKEFLMVPEFFSEILLEAKSISELSTPQKEIDRKLGRVYEINMQLDALSERLGLLPKSVNPKHVFDQMEKLSVQKQNLEDEIKNLKAKSSTEKVPVSISDFESFKLIIQDLLENEADPKIKTAIIQKVVHKIVIKNEEVEIYFFIGEKHYKRELAIAGSRPLPRLVEATNPNVPEKRHTSPLPVFHGNPKTSDFLNFKPKKLYDAGSNSLKNGRG
ncbi:MAG: recombinase family protein [Pseudobdellovibrionaceae bacterium]